MSERIYLSTTIPYVNARPHLGHALELVQADVLARHHRQRGDGVWFQTGTDDNSLKQVLAAQAEGVAVADLVSRNAAEFEGLRGPLELSFDDFIRTGSDPRHRPAAERLWRACAERGDLYRRTYQGLYCVGCEQFYREAELVGGRCREHGTEPELVAEENWFFRLSRYGSQLHELIGSGRLRVEPAARRNEVLSFIAAGLEDFSISRSRERAHGWGIPVPGDPGQVMYVWWDALCNYISSLGYGTGGADYPRWWQGSSRRIHVVGKGVLRFHAVYWPAMLLSAGQPLPTDVLVHDYLTAGGRKISKSGGAPADPVALAGRYGTDAVRWWLLREVPRVGDADFTEERLADRANADLAGGLGNLASRTVAMVHRYRDGVVPGGHGPLPADPAAGRLRAACLDAPGRVRAALDGHDFRAATAAVWRIVDEANRYIELTQPWQLAKAERAAGQTEVQAERPEAPAGRPEPQAGRTETQPGRIGPQAGPPQPQAGPPQPQAGPRQPQAGPRQAQAGPGALDAVLAHAVAACRCLADLLAPFVPGAAARVAAQCGPDHLPPAAPVFARVA